MCASSSPPFTLRNAKPEKLTGDRGVFGRLIAAVCNFGAVARRDIWVPDECRLECTSAMQQWELDAFLIAGVSIRNPVSSDPSTSRHGSRDAESAALRA